MKNNITNLQSSLAYITDSKNCHKMYFDRPEIINFDVSANPAVQVELDGPLEIAFTKQPEICVDLKPLISTCEKEVSCVVVFLPGIEKKDTGVNVPEHRLAMETRNGSEPYRKRVPCNVNTDQSAILEKPLSNSVPEIVPCRTNPSVIDR